MLAFEWVRDGWGIDASFTYGKILTGGYSDYSVKFSKLA
jgi:hypothetical protein